MEPERQPDLSELLADTLAGGGPDAQVLVAHFRGELADERERETVDEWLAASPAHRDRYRVLCAFETAREASAAAPRGRAVASWPRWLAKPWERVSGFVETRPGPVAALVAASVAALAVVAVLRPWAPSPQGGPERVAADLTEPRAVAEEGGTRTGPLQALEPPEEREGAARVRDLARETPPASAPPERLSSPEPSQGAPTEGRSEPESPIEQIAALGAPSYSPPDPFEPLTRSAPVRAAMASVPAVEALAPEHVAYTAEPSPTLYWFTTGTEDLDVEVRLEDEVSIDPLLEIRLPAPVEAGIHRVSLAEHRVTLEPGQVYHWSVTLRTASGSDLPLARSRAAIGRREPSPEVAQALVAGSPARRGHILASSGLWYDALGFFSAWIDRHPRDPVLRADRAALLRQVGLAEAAAHEALADTER